MNYKLYTLLILLICGVPFHTGISAQSLPDSIHHRLEVQLDYYPNDTLILGYFYGKGQYAKDTVLRGKDNKFVFAGKDTLPQGMYFVMTRPNNNYLQFIIGEDQDFKVHSDYLALNDSLRFEGSEENDILLRYTHFLDKMSPKAQHLREKITSDLISDAEKDSLKTVLKGLDDKVKIFQKRLIRQYPASSAAALIKVNREPAIPEFQATGDSLKTLQFDYYKRHYFDSLDLKDDRLLYSPFLFPKVSSYVERLTIQVPDSVNRALDTVFGRMNPGSQVFKYFLPYFLNHYISSKYVGLDAVFVHIAKQYYAKGMAPWMSEENLKKLIKEADKLAPILIGKQAPDITVFDQTGKAIRLYDIDADFTILVFWAPDCSHCKKEMPKLAQWYEKQNKDSIKVLAVCTKLLDKEKNCWDFVKEKHTDILMNASDKYLKSKFSVKYNVHTTPSIFVLDRKKKILIKKIGVEQLDEVIKNLREIERQEKS